MKLSDLVDDFVAKMNASEREYERPEDVPLELRDGDPDDGWTCWKIKPFDHEARIQELEKRLRLRFPPSFHDFISRYSFPAFEFGPVMLFANTGQDVFWELENKLFLDPNMSPALLKAGYLQIGNPFFYNYDPVCIEAPHHGGEGRIVQLDHEEILCFKQIEIVAEVAPSFVELLRQLIATSNSPEN
jgi:hypothetical protein